MASGATTTFFYDDWNLIYEHVANTNGTVDAFQYFWGRDLSGTLQGAGGVGGLLYVKHNGTIYVPHADAMGNILRYTDTAGNVVASYTYDAFGRTISATGPHANLFRHRFSTKYFDSETGLYYYGYRYYSPPFMRWLNCDPIGEDGGVNLYAFCRNDPVSLSDSLGLATISDYILGNIGYDKSWGLLGPYGLPVPALGARLQIQFYVSGNFAECCKNGRKATYAVGTVGAEAFLTWGLI